MFFQHHRFKITTSAQHTYKHSLAEFPYTNPALPPSSVVNVEQALNWILAVLYPNQQPAVDTPGDLPGAGNTLNDYRVVLDDGDGKSAGYRWEQREGDVAAQWYKIYDMDWGESTVLSNFLLKTQDVYVYRHGIDDLDATGTPFAGDLAGQRIYGGESAGSHLILYANAGDGTGANTGFVQLGDDARPLTHDTFTLGTATRRWLDFHAVEANIGTMQIVGGSITDSSGAIDFGDEALGTSGTIGAGTLLLAGGSITDASGAISFDDEDLTTTGQVTANSVVAVGAASSLASGTTVGDLTLADGSITDSSGAISFGDEDLSTTGSGTFASVIVDTLTLDGATIYATGNLILAPVGFVDVQGALDATGNLSTDGVVNIGASDDVTISDTAFNSDGPYTFSTTVSGGILLDPFDGLVTADASLIPSADAVRDLGNAARWRDIYLSGGLSDGTDSMSMATLISLRDVNVGANIGDTIFFDGTDWYADAPSSSVDHGATTGLGDDDHTHYALLLGRATGQELIGGIAAGEDLILDSTSHATKGSIFFKSNLEPFTDAVIDLGGSGQRVRDLYMSGEGIGFRMENAANVGALPGASGSNPGRVAWVTGTDTMYVDTGGVWKALTSDKYVNDDAVNWDGTNTVQAYNVSSQIDDARNAIWQFLDNTNSFRIVDGAVITKTQTTVTVTCSIPPASGTYRLVGVG